MTSGARLIVEEDGLYGGLAGYRVIAVLDLDERAPNVAILFDRAIDFPAVRRRGMFFTREPRPGAREPGVAVRVKDPEAAREAFADWGVVRDLTLDDVAYARRLRRRP
jgi:hypothetical protein